MVSCTLLGWGRRIALVCAVCLAAPAAAEAPPPSEDPSEAKASSPATARPEDAGGGTAALEAGPLAPPARFRPEGAAKVFLPAAGILGENVALWAFDLYVLEAEYSDISLDSIATNFEQGFTWDDNDFVVNQFGHPYQGAVYFRTARAAGHGFWSAIPYVVFGSLQWELFMETERPAINDLVTTTLGGVVLGEVMHRSARLVRDDGTSGVERFLREALAAALDPASALGRLLNGRTFLVGSPSPRVPYRLALSLGMDRIGRPEDRDAQVRLFHAELDLVHGALPGRGEAIDPFDRFTVAVGLNAGRSFSASRLDFDGVVTGVPLACGKVSRCLLGGVAHFDFAHSPLFKVGTTAIGGGLFAELPLGGGWQLDFDLEIMAVVLGGFDSPYAAQYGPQYNLGHGGLWRSRLALHAGRWSLTLASDRYVVRTVYGAQGRELAGISETILSIPLPWESLSLELGSGLFDRSSELDDFDDLHRVVLVGQTHLVWSW